MNIKCVFISFLFYFVLNCTNFGKLILRKIINTAATGCYISKLCTKFDFGWNPRPCWGSLQSPLNPLTGTKGAYFIIIGLKVMHPVTVCFFK